MEKKKRQAVIIGINDYNDPEIPTLSGAVNDATEMCQRLREFGDFEITEDHFLTGKKADCTSIRKAISDLLWRADDCDLALLYFSGHGFLDGYGNGYIAPCDMTKNEPFVSGINMQELKQIVSRSLNKQCVFVILDCCYSGIPTKGEKAVSEIGTSLEPYFDNLSKEMSGEGKIIFASSGEDQKSRETELKIIDGKNACHGIFTYHLIEGLDGKAADETGDITLDRLCKHVEDQFKDKKQKPKFFATDSRNLDQIWIATASVKLENFIRESLEEVEKLLKILILPDDPSSPVDPSFLFKAADKIGQVLERNNTNAEAIKLRLQIDEILMDYRKSVNVWIRDNQFDVRQKIHTVFLELDKLVPSLNFQDISKLNHRSKNLLLNLCDVSIKNDNDRFIERVGYLGNPSGTPGQTQNSRIRN